MAQNIQVIIIDPNKGSAQEIEKAVTSLDRHISLTGTALSIDQGYDLIAKNRPMIVVLDIDYDPDASFGLVSKVLGQYPGTCFFATSANSSSDNILKAMRGGCTEFLLKPVTTMDLMNAFHKFGRIVVQQPAQPKGENGRILSVFSPKGGMGTTTVATNLAVCLHQQTKKSVVLVDLDLEAGDAAMFLNLKSRYSIADVTSNIARLDKSFLEGVLAKHSSGIYFMAEPERVEDAEVITAGQVREVLTVLKSMFNYVVVDTGIGYDEINLAAFDLSELVILVGILSLPAIKNMQKALDVFERLGYHRDKVRLVINRYLRKSEITPEDAQKALNYEMFWRVPNDYNEVVASINRGLPLSMLTPNSDISKSFRDMAVTLKDQIEKASHEHGRAGRA